MDTDLNTWAEDYFAACVTLVRPSTPDSLVAALYGGTARPIASLWSEDDGAPIPTEECDGGWVMADTRDGWTVAWDDNGFEGAQQEVALSLSQGGTYLSMYWNVNSVMRLIVAHDGKIVRCFDPLSSGNRPPPEGDWAEFGMPLAQEAGLPWDDAPRSSGLRLITQIAGITDVTLDWFASPTARFWAPPPIPMD